MAEEDSLGDCQAVRRKSLKLSFDSSTNSNPPPNPQPPPRPKNTLESMGHPTQMCLPRGGQQQQQQQQQPQQQQQQKQTPPPRPSLTGNGGLQGGGEPAERHRHHYTHHHHYHNHYSHRHHHQHHLTDGAAPLAPPPDPTGSAHPAGPAHPLLGHASHPARTDVPWHAQRDVKAAERRRQQLSSMSPSPGGVRYIWGHIGRIRRERIRAHSLESTGKLQISPELIFDFTADDLTDQGEIGRGAYGTVNKMYHEQSNTVMAVKRIRSTVDEKEQKQLLMDLDVVMRSNECPFIVQFFGALFKEGDCWICMELMSISLDKFYKYVYGTMQNRIPEEILGKITVATLKALSYLKDKLRIIHRDVKPSNILMDTSGNIKLCDFGISGQLVDSIAKTRDAGCRPYMAPERIDPRASSRGYDIRSDVWSLGITLVEVATGKFPYPKWSSVFEQLTQVVQGEPPTLKDNDDRFSPNFITFVNTCLIKDQELRPKYNKLLRHVFIQTYEGKEVDVAGYVSMILEQMPLDRSQLDSQSSS